jgi:hypothetical protein
MQHYGWIGSSLALLLILTACTVTNTVEIPEPSPAPPTSATEPEILPTPAPPATTEPEILPTPAPPAATEPEILPTPAPPAATEPEILPTPAPITAPSSTPPPTVIPEPAGVEQRIQFAPGTSSARVEGAVVRGTRDRYILGASEGQYMRVSISALEENAVFSIVQPDGQPIPGTEEGQDTRYWEGSLPQSGDYTVVVGGTRGNATYTLDVAITDSP